MVYGVYEAHQSPTQGSGDNYIVYCCVSCGGGLCGSCVCFMSGLCVKGIMHQNFNVILIQSCGSSEIM